MRGDRTQRRELHQLVRQLRSWRPALRAEAARRIGLLGACEATDELARLARDSRRDVRLAALVALLRVGPSQFVTTAMERSRAPGRAELLADLDAVVETIGAMRHGTR